MDAVGVEGERRKAEQQDRVGRDVRVQAPAGGAGNSTADGAATRAPGWR